MNYFPLRIRYTDKNEVLIVNDPKEIQDGRAFIVEQTNCQWGRKPMPCSRREYDYESA